MANGILDFDRDRGIFTPRDRRFLAGELDEELSDNAARQKRWRLRKRMFHAIQDLAYLRWMDTNDISQLVGDIKDGIARTSRPGENSTDVGEGESVDIERFLSATDESIRLFGEIYTLEMFRGMVGRQLGELAAIQHYERTGEFGVFDVTLEIEQTGTMSVDELQKAVREEELLLNPEPNPLEQRYPGFWEVLQRHYDEHPYAVIESFTAGNDSEIEYPELCPAVSDAIEELADTSPADRRRVGRLVAEKEDVSRKTADRAVRDALLSGRCYEPEEGYLRTV